MTEYIYTAVLICTNRDAGNGLAALAASFPNDPAAEAGTFADARMLSPQAWFAVIPAKSSFAGVCQAIADGAGYDDARLSYLRDRGVTEQQWAAAKAIVTAAVYDRSAYSQSDLETFVASHGYSIVPPQEEP